MILKIFSLIAQRYIIPQIYKISASLGYININYPIVYGDKTKILSPPGMSLAGVLLNTRSGTITIGTGCIFGHNVMLLTGKHIFENNAPKVPKELTVDNNITIGNNCWIASGSIIIGGVTLGNGCIVQAGSVVTRNSPDNSIIGGSPAHLKSHRGHRTGRPMPDDWQLEQSSRKEDA